MNACNVVERARKTQRRKTSTFAGPLRAIRRKAKTHRSKHNTQKQTKHTETNIIHRIKKHKQTKT